MGSRILTRNVHLLLLEANVEFVWWGEVCTVIFTSNPTTVLRLCCVVVGVVTICVTTCRLFSIDKFFCKNVWEKMNHSKLFQGVVAMDWNNCKIAIVLFIYVLTHKSVWQSSELTINKLEWVLTLISPVPQSKQVITPNVFIKTRFTHVSNCG